MWLCHVTCSKGASQSLVEGYLEKQDSEGHVMLHAVEGPASQSIDCYLEKHDRVWSCHITCSTGAGQSLVEGYLEKQDSEGHVMLHAVEGPNNPCFVCLCVCF